ncbi:3599_t:CDS:10 [Acaulospora colombiana]|uniref:3599_t:CDS:1 n=1 Tax=Acaulospora colombiana TaxID=27376 RepID=A0ACA9LX49_9GLOM|nr:3599_t:CDS:10 [Acaulospora colombiana]
MKDSSYAHAQVELKISCAELSNLDYLSKTDPQVVLLTKDSKTQRWCHPPHATEVIKNNKNPNFVKSIVVNYSFEELQQYRFLVVNVNNHKSTDWGAQEFIGRFDLGSRGSKVKGKLFSPKHPEKKRGFIIITAKELSNSKREARLQFQSYNVGEKGRFFEAKPKLFFVLSRINEDKTISPVYESTDVASMNPLWPAFTIKEATLCNGDPDRKIIFQVKQRKRNGGQHSFTLREIMTGNRKFPLWLPSGDASKNARVEIIQAQIEEPPTFLDYVLGGTQISLAVAIDFTASNGDPRSLKSLHYANGTKDNDYQKAIRSVGSILESYGYDRRFPVYGFGGKFGGALSHVYPLNHDAKNPEVEGINGVLAAYFRTIKFVELHGPTYFSPAIIEASSLPLSIVIVGVGNADFTDMTILDSEDYPLKSGNRNERALLKPERNIVKFVALRDFQSKTAQHQLPKAVLKGIPDQFMSYVMTNNIKPHPPVYVENEKLSLDCRFDATVLDDDYYI